jgi:hypothetical protein
MGRGPSLRFPTLHLRATGVVKIWVEGRCTSGSGGACYGVLVKWGIWLCSHAPAPRGKAASGLRSFLKNGFVVDSAY